MINEQFDLDKHVDYQIADNQVTTKELQVKYEKSKNIPTLNAFVNYSTFAANDNNIFFENNGNWFDSSLLGVSLNIPIFSSMERKSRTQQAKMGLDQKIIELDQTSQKLKLQVETAKNRYQFALDQLLQEPVLKQVSLPIFLFNILNQYGCCLNQLYI